MCGVDTWHWDTEREGEPPFVWKSIDVGIDTKYLYLLPAVGMLTGNTIVDWNKKIKVSINKNLCC